MATPGPQPTPPTPSGVETRLTSRLWRGVILLIVFLAIVMLLVPPDWRGPLFAIAVVSAIVVSLTLFWENISLIDDDQTLKTLLFLFLGTLMGIIFGAAGVFVLAPAVIAPEGAVAPAAGPTIILPTPVAPTPALPRTTATANPDVTATAPISTTPAPPVLESTFERVLRRGEVVCGINGQLAGFSDEQDQGFEADYCRVVATAIFGTYVDHLRFVDLDARQRFDLLRATNDEERVDVVFRNTTWTVNRDTRNGVDFGPPIFYDGQRFLVRQSLGVSNLTDLRELSEEKATTDDPLTVCYIPGAPDSPTTTARNLERIFTELDITYEPITAGDEGEFGSNNALIGYFTADDTCDVATSDGSQLAISLFELGLNRDEFVLLGDTISKEPLAPMVLEEADRRWYYVVTYAIYATIYATEVEINRENVEDRTNLATCVQTSREAAQPTVGQAPAIEQVEIDCIDSVNLLNLDWDDMMDYSDIPEAYRSRIQPDFVFNIISELGSYEDLYERNLLGIADEAVLNQDQINVLCDFDPASISQYEGREFGVLNDICYRDWPINRMALEGGILYAPPFPLDVE